MRTILISLFALTMLISGCASKEPLTMVTQSQTCHSPQKRFAIEIVEDAQSWQQLFSTKFASTQLPPPPLPDVDLEHDVLIVIDMGERPNTAYSLQLASEEALLQSGVLSIPVKTTSPVEGLSYAQMITHPCLALTIPKRPFEKIHVIDQNGIVLATLEVEAQ